MSRPLPIGTECWADIGGFVVEAVVKGVRRPYGDTQFYEIDWLGSAGKWERQGSVLRADLFADLADVERHCERQISFWIYQLDRFSKMGDDEEVDPAQLDREQQEAYEEIRAEEQRELEVE